MSETKETKEEDKVPTLEEKKPLQDIEKEMTWQTLLTGFAQSVNMYTCGDPLKSNMCLNIDTSSRMSPLMVLFHCLQSIEDRVLRASIEYKMETLILLSLNNRGSRPVTAIATKAESLVTQEEHDAWKAVCDRLHLFSVDWEASRAFHDERIDKIRCKEVVKSGKHKGKPCNRVQCGKHKRPSETKDDETESKPKKPRT